MKGRLIRTAYESDCESLFRRSANECLNSLRNGSKRRKGDGLEAALTHVLVAFRTSPAESRSQIGTESVFAAQNVL